MVQWVTTQMHARGAENPLGRHWVYTWKRSTPITAEFLKADLWNSNENTQAEIRRAVQRDLWKRQRYGRNVSWEQGGGAWGMSRPQAVGIVVNWDGWKFTDTCEVGKSSSAEETRKTCLLSPPKAESWKSWKVNEWSDGWGREQLASDISYHQWTDSQTAGCTRWGWVESIHG